MGRHVYTLKVHHQKAGGKLPREGFVVIPPGITWTSSFPDKGISVSVHNHRATGDLVLRVVPPRKRLRRVLDRPLSIVGGE